MRHSCCCVILVIKFGNLLYVWKWTSNLTRSNFNSAENSTKWTEDEQIIFFFCAFVLFVMLSEKTPNLEKTAKLTSYIHSNRIQRQHCQIHLLRRTLSNRWHKISKHNHSVEQLFFTFGRKKAEQCSHGPCKIVVKNPQQRKTSQSEKKETQRESPTQTMLLKRQAKNKLYDILHYGTVYICMGATAISTAYLGWYGYKYFTVIRPQKKIELLDKIKSEGIDNAETLKSWTKGGRKIEIESIECQ